MGRWSDLVSDIRSISEDEKAEIYMVADIMADLIAQRNILGLTQEQVAERAGLKQSAVARLESGTVTPKLDTFAKIARVLELDIRLVPKSEIHEEAAATATVGAWG